MDEPAAGSADPTGGAQLARLPRWLPPACALAILLLVGAAYGSTLRYPLFGLDSYAIVATSRVDSLGELFGGFTEVYMDGRFKYDFYRPVLSLIFALEYALWGVEPAGYQLTNLLAAAGAALGLFFLLRRLLGPRAALGPLLAVFVFVLWPGHFGAIPVAAQRHDALCCLFFALAVRAHLAPRALATGGPCWWGGLFTLLALGIKEVAFALPPVLLVAVFVYSPRRGLGARLRHSAIAAAPSLLALGALLAARWTAIGGLGGRGVVVESAGGIFVQLLRNSAAPIEVMESGTPWVALGLAAILAAAGIFAASSAGPTGGRRRGLIVGLTWFAGTALLVSLSGVDMLRQAYMPLAGLALILGVSLDGAGAALRRRPLVAGLALLPATAILVWFGSWSPLTRPWPAWDLAAQRMETYLDELQVQLDRARPGDLITSPPTPTTVWPQEVTDPDAVTSTRARPSILGPRSVRGWAELRFPGLRFDVRSIDADRPRQGQDPTTVRILLSRWEP